MKIFPLISRNDLSGRDTDIALKTGKMIFQEIPLNRGSEISLFKVKTMLTFRKRSDPL
ncbi:MAG: hypothetical protein ACXAEU_05570 [Candidatus Hodarchaeales archaeon]|jgi:hypothetical protein